MTRRQMRENCFILLFERAFTEYTTEDLFALAAECDEVKLNNTVRQYYTEISEHFSEIDEISTTDLSASQESISSVSCEIPACFIRHVLK